MLGPIRFVMTATGLILIGLSVAAFAFSEKIESWCRARLQDRLARLYDTQVEIERFHFAPLELGAAAEGVTLYNPEGFPPGPAITIDRVVFRPDFRTLFSEQIALDEIILDNLRLDQPGRGRNIEQLMANARNAQDSEESGVEVRRVKCTGGAFGAITLRPFDSGPAGEGPAVSEGDVRRQLLMNLGLDLVTLKGLLPFAS